METRVAMKSVRDGLERAFARRLPDGTGVEIAWNFDGSSSADVYDVHVTIFLGLS